MVRRPGTGKGNKLRRVKQESGTRQGRMLWGQRAAVPGRGRARKGPVADGTRHNPCVTGSVWAALPPMFGAQVVWKLRAPGWGVAGLGLSPSMLLQARQPRHSIVRKTTEAAPSPRCSQVGVAERDPNDVPLLLCARSPPQRPRPASVHRWRPNTRSGTGQWGLGPPVLSAPPKPGKGTRHHNFLSLLLLPQHSQTSSTFLLKGTSEKP